MKIIRNGIEYELTTNELWKAFCEQQHLNDITTIDLNLKSYLSEEKIENVKSNKDFFDIAACNLRSNLDDLNMDFDVAMSKALEDAYDEFDFATEEDEL